MLESLQEPVPTPPWPVPHNYSSIVSLSWFALVIARHTEWRNSPATQELERALEDLMELTERLYEYAKVRWFQPWWMCSDYRAFSKRLTHLHECWKRYNGFSAQLLRPWIKVHVIDSKDEGTPSQWNLRAQLAAQSETCHARFRPLERHGQLITFPPETPPNLIITRVPGKHNIWSPRDSSLPHDSWSPNVPSTQSDPLPPTYDAAQGLPNYLAHTCCQ